jgi:hypothetical protein
MHAHLLLLDSWYVSRHDELIIDKMVFVYPGYFWGCLRCPGMVVTSGKRGGRACYEMSIRHVKFLSLHGIFLFWQFYIVTLKHSKGNDIYLRNCWFMPVILSIKHMKVDLSNPACDCRVILVFLLTGSPLTFWPFSICINANSVIKSIKMKFRKHNPNACIWDMTLPV